MKSSQFQEMQEDIEKQLASIAKTVFRRQKIGVQDNFFELGGNSLVAGQIAAKAREAGLQVAPQNLYQHQTIAELSAAVAGKIDSEPVFNWESEAALDPAINPSSLSYKYENDPDSVLLTGSTGFIGAFLLDELLARTNAKIYCLVRAADIQAGRERIQNNLKSYSFTESALNSRIIPVLGDLSKPLLGLSSEEFEHLSERIDMIYHNGALVNLIFPYSTLKPVNVTGTVEILRLAAQTKIKSVHFISSVSVFRSPFYTDLIYESDRPDCELIKGSSMASQGYLRSKCIGEHLVMAAHKLGIPGSIYRIGNITGHSRTGTGNNADFHSCMIKGCIQLGKAPLWNEKVFMTPVDYISEAVVHLSRKKESAGKSYHLVTADTLTWAEIFNLVSYLYPLEIVPIEQWYEDLSKTVDEKENVLSPFLSTMLPDFLKEETGSLNFDCKNALAGLADSSTVCPLSDKTLLDIYFADFVRSGYLNAPETSLKLTRYAHI